MVCGSKVELRSGKRLITILSNNNVIEDFIESVKSSAEKNSLNLEMTIKTNNTKNAQNFLLQYFDVRESHLKSIWDTFLTIDDVYKFKCYLIEVLPNQHIKVIIGNSVGEITKEKLGFDVIGNDYGVVFNN